MKRILITGSSGFVGRHLCRALKRKGYQVIGAYLGPLPHRSPGVSYISTDMTVWDQVHGLIKETKPDGIVHLAAQSVPQLSWMEIRQTFSVNVLGTIHLLNAMRQEIPKSRLLFISSQQVYGRTFQTHPCIREKDPVYPENPYAVSKLLGEFACLNFYSQFGLRIMIARPSNHAGKGQSPHFAFSDWIQQIAASEAGKRDAVLEVGNLSVARDFLHIADVVRAYEILLLRGKPGGIYNVASGHVRKIREYADEAMKLARIPMKLKVRESRFRKNDMKRACASSRKIRHLGWMPTHSPFSALQDLLDEWRSEYKIL